MAGKISCSLCGAKFNEAEPRCPYCGSTNIKGAEREYLEKLSGVREDLKELDQVAGQELKKTIRDQGSRLKKIILRISAVGIALMLGVVLIKKLPDLIFRPEMDEMEEFLWQQEHFKELNELYDMGRYEELLELYHTLEEEASLYGWEHSDFISLYDHAFYVEEALGREARGETMFYNEKNFALLLFDELYVVGALEFRSDEFTEEEKAYLETYRVMAQEDLDSRWYMTPEEYDAFYQELATFGGCPRLEMCDEYIELWLERR